MKSREAKTCQYYSSDALGKVADKISYFANKEGLSAHGKSATVRFEK